MANSIKPLEANVQAHRNNRLVYILNFIFPPAVSNNYVMFPSFTVETYM